MLLVVTLQGSWPRALRIVRSPKLLLVGALTGFLLSSNWLTYVWAITSGYVLEASLGYFITPIFSIFLGVFVLGEKLRRLQWISVGIALSGVCFFTYQHGYVPWIALVLATTFSCYGLFRKVGQIGAIDGFLLESSLMLAPAIGYVCFLNTQSTAVVSTASTFSLFLLLCSGPITVLPICLFTYGAQRCQLTTIGMLQFLSPTMQFCLAVFLYKEGFGFSKQLFFGVILLAVALYNYDLLQSKRGRSRVSEFTPEL